MLIIPVLDISRGLVVQAIKGERKHYKAISSVIATTPEPITVVNAFLELYPFKIIYIADLDAIQNHDNQSSLIKQLAQQFQDCHFWVDAGQEINNRNNYKADNITLIIGSEHSLPKKSLTTLIKNNPDCLLSLDFSQNGLIENNYLLEDTLIWPQRLIVMMLHRVGSSEGIDFQCLAKVLAMGDEHEFYSAGGIRDINDLKELSLTNVKGVLLATALHNGTITKENLTEFIKDVESS